MGQTIGTRIREVRTARRLSLSVVALKASISTATLSRIETGKQSIDVGLLVVLAGILQMPTHELLSEESNDGADVADRIARLKAPERARLWRELSGQRKRSQTLTRMHDLSSEVDELLAQIDFLRGEVERIRQSIRARRAPKRAAPR